MKRYFLLRKNREAGPFSRLQLKALGLLPTDLIWIDGESASWQHPTEISGLRTISQTGVLQQLPVTNNMSSSAETPLQSYFSVLAESEQKTLGNDQQNNRRANRANFSFVAFSRTVGFGVLATAAVLCIYVLSQMFNRFGLEQKAASEAVEIQPVSLTENAVSRSAFGLSPLPAKEPLIANANAPFSDSSGNKLLSEKKGPAAKARPAPEKKVMATEQSTSADSVATNEIIAAAPEEKAEPQINYAATLQLSANDYKVGLFGGISNLEIIVANQSSEKIERATLEVEFLKPNGNVIKTQLLTVEDIEAGSSKVVAVPSSNRGVKVRYRITAAD